METKSISRRDLLKSTGVLIVGFSFFGPASRALAQGSGLSVDGMDPTVLDSWLAISKDGTVTVFTGKAEIGMGVETGLTQIVAEELDVSFSRVVFVMGDTSTTADQGGVGGSTSIAMGSKPLRNVAATARALLVRLAAKNLGALPEDLQVREGVVSVKADPSRKISYAELAASGMGSHWSIQSRLRSRFTSGLAQSSRATPGRPLRLFFADASATLAFCPLDGGSDEFVGVFGGLPARPSSSASAALRRVSIRTRTARWTRSRPASGAAP